MRKRNWFAGLAVAFSLLISSSLSMAYNSNMARHRPEPYSHYLYEKWIRGHSSNWSLTPAVGSNGTIYEVGDNQLYAIGPQNGEIKWKHPLAPGLEYFPAVGKDGTIYVESGNHLTAIAPDGTQKWQISGEKGSWFASPAAIGKGTIYVTVRPRFQSNGSSLLKAVSLNEGAEKWENNLPGLGENLAIGEKGTIYVMQSQYGGDSSLKAVSPDDGRVEWTWKPEGFHEFLAPAIGPDGAIYAVDKSGSLYAVSPDGKQKWSYKIRDLLPPYRFSIKVQGGISAPVVANNGTIYFVKRTIGAYVPPRPPIHTWNGHEQPYRRGSYGYNPYRTGEMGATIYKPSSQDRMAEVAVVTTLYAMRPGHGILWKVRNLDESKIPYSILKRYGHDYHAPRGPFSPVIGGDGTVFAALGEKLYAVGPDGHVKATLSGYGLNRANSSLVMDKNGVIYLVLKRNAQKNGIGRTPLCAISTHSRGPSIHGWPMLYHDARHTGEGTPEYIVPPKPLLPGDCNGDGRISRQEVYTAAYCYFGRINSCCAKSDLDHNGKVTIDEVQKVFNLYWQNRYKQR